MGNFDKFCQKDCPICSGFGYISRDVPTSDPRYGKLFVCPLWARSKWNDKLGITEEEGDKLDWSTFMPTKLMTKAVPVMKDLLEAGMGWVYIHSIPGVGKTHLAKATVMQAWYIYGFSARYLTEQDALNYFRSSFGDKLHKNEYIQRMKELTEIDFLVIDEVGRDRGTDFGNAAYSELLDKRYTRALDQRSMTLFGANFPPEKVLDDYQVDRVRDGRFTVMEIPGPSVRPLLRRNTPRMNSRWWYRALPKDQWEDARSD